MGQHIHGPQQGVKMQSSRSAPAVGLAPHSPHGMSTLASTGSKTPPRAGQGAQHPSQRGTKLEMSVLNLHEGDAAPGGTPQKGFAHCSGSPCLQKHRSIRSMFFRRSLLQESK